MQNDREKRGVSPFEKLFFIKKLSQQKNYAIIEKKSLFAANPFLK